jgi:hypothetical protein
VRALFNEYTGHAAGSSFVISEKACRAIRFLKDFLLMVATDEGRFARPSSSFEPSTHRYVIEFEASLSGVGLIWYRVDDEGNEVPVGGSAVDLLPLAFGSSASNQNTAEITAAMLGVRGLRSLGIMGPCPVF